MISVEEALERILSYIPILEPEEKPILDALGQVLTEDVNAPFDIPPHDNSAMDGYAVQAASTKGASKASPKVLTVIEEVPAGYVAQKTVGPGKAIRIMTGAPMPKGADTVVEFEETDEEARKATQGHGLKQIGILTEVPPGKNIRYAGEDVRRGQRIMAEGAVLRPAEIGVLASLGHATVKVIRRPVVAVLSTGDELAAVGEPLTPGKIYDANSYSVASLIKRYGGIPKPLGIACDTIEALTQKIYQGLDADMLITSAGVSVGDYDVVKDVLARLGEITFWTVRMRPGKPLAFGLLGQKSRNGERKIPHLGLPGNPVSSMVAFEQFGRPAIMKMMGKTNFAKPTVNAILEEPVTNKSGRRLYLRAVMSKRDGRYYASLTGPQGSGILTSMMYANGLAIIPEDTQSVKKGNLVKVQMLDWMEAQD